MNFKRGHSVMANDRLGYLFAKYIAQDITATELNEFYGLVASDDHDGLLKDLSDAYYAAQNFEGENAIINEDAVLQKVLGVKVKQAGVAAKLNASVKWFAAASILLVIGFGLRYYTNYLNKEQTMLAAQQILPAKNVATLTLADGKVLVLDTLRNGAVIYNNDMKISKTQSGEILYQVMGSTNNDAINTIQTPKGGNYKILLGDGTAVWLNAETRLEFPAHFRGDTRTVNLEGEAYFEVAKVKGKAFVVKSGAQFVEVLGTHFNVKAYADDDTKTTTLLEGSVRTGNAQQSTLLRPGQQAEVFDKGQIKVGTADVESIMAWRNGEFVFKGKSLAQVMKEVSRWYDVEVVLNDNVNAKNIKLMGWVSRKKDLSAIIKNIETATGLTLKVEERRVVISN